MCWSTTREIFPPPEIEGYPLYDPNRHTRLKLVRWDDNGMPDFGIPPADTL